MVIIQICVGSSCHIKGAPDIIQLLEKNVAENKLEDDIVLTGSFCTGMCNRIGVTVSVNDDVHTGITKENFSEFWNGVVMEAVKKNRG